MGGESLGLWRGDVGVDLHGCPRSSGQSWRPVGRPPARSGAKPEDDRRPSSEQTHDGIVLHPVRDRRAAPPDGELATGQNASVLRQSDEGAQSPLAQQFVGGLQGRRRR